MTTVGSHFQTKGEGGAGRRGKDLRRAVRGCLADLGDSPQVVATRLHGYGVTGLPGRADDCPMARYLRALIGSERSVGRIGVLEQRLRVTRRGLHLPFSVALPPAIRSFVRSFDEGRYPELVDRHPGRGAGLGVGPTDGSDRNTAPDQHRA